MSETAEFIAGKIKAIRSYRGLSQRAVAEALNVSLRTYQGWEKDFTSSVDNLIKICRVFEVEPLDFLEPLLYHNTLTPEHIDI
ncbi:MAG: helix-turn-helix transcriptional regulator, partial [Candidatus Omnitrophica bacterium]|nr:helix-turn-helix transcriptional regulator [Candidatus Omnitrophota bacterium]